MLRLSRSESDRSEFENVCNQRQSLRAMPRGMLRFERAAGAGPFGSLARKDAPVPITATARELACLICTLVTRGEVYVKRGIQTYERRCVGRTVSNLGRRAKLFGYQLVRLAEDRNGTIDAEAMAYGISFHERPDSEPIEIPAPQKCTIRPPSKSFKSLTEIFGPSEICSGPVCHYFRSSLVPASRHPSSGCWRSCA